MRGVRAWASSVSRSLPSPGGRRSRRRVRRGRAGSASRASRRRRRRRAPARRRVRRAARPGSGIRTANSSAVDPRQHVEVPQLAAQRLGEHGDDPADVARARFARELRAILEPTDADARARSRAPRPARSPRGAAGRGRPRSGRPVSSSKLRCCRFSRWERAWSRAALDVGDEAAEDLQIVVVEAAREEAVEGDLVVDRERSDHLPAALERRRQERAQVFDEGRELGVEARVLDQVRRAPADRGDGDRLVEAEERSPALAPSAAPKYERIE